MQILHFKVQPLPPKAHTTLLHADVKCCVNIKSRAGDKGCSTWAVDGDDASRQRQTSLLPLLPAPSSSWMNKPASPEVLSCFPSCFGILPVQNWFALMQKKKRIAKLADCHKIPVPMRRVSVKNVFWFQVAFWLQSTLQVAEGDGAENLTLHGTM